MVVEISLEEFVGDQHQTTPVSLAELNKTLRSWEKRNWSPTKESSWFIDKFSYQYHGKYIENGMENMHADVGV